MEHTKEPWERTDGDIWNVVPDKDGDPEQQLIAQSNQDDARRIVACVNACAGIDTERLELNAKDPIAGIFGRMASNAETDKKNAIEQRDKLLAALKEIAEHPTNHEETAISMRKIARKAIEKIEGEK